jgi:hypothetical protein
MTNIYNIHNLLNDIFNSTFSNIYKKNKIIKSEISEKNLVYYKFKYSEINKTKQNIVSAINYKNNTTHNVTSYYRKEQHLSINTYSDILININKLYLSLCPTTNKLISIDGTYGNTNIQRKKGKLQTTLFMCYYDVTNSVPLDINFKNNKKNDNNRNNEVSLAEQWINKNKSKCNKSIIIADRAYHKSKFFNFLISNNIEFVIRIKNNAKNRNLNNCRYISKEFIIYKKILNKKTNKMEKIECTNKYTLITNLCKDKYTNEQILDIYNKRWDIEVYFKYIKNNFKLQHLKEHKSRDDKKILICQSIIVTIARIIKKLFFTLNENKDKHKDKDTYKINETLLIKGIFDYLLLDIINGELTFIKLKNFVDSYCIYIKNDLNRTFERVSLIPFTKWYIKKYHYIYKYTKILKALIDGDISSLNKNLKSKAKTKILV